MNIKEVAQALELKMQDPDDGRFDIGEFAEALISAYKAELLKEVGEPGTWEFRTYNAETDEVIYHVTQSWLEAKHYDQFPMPLFTSDQLAAAILKATGPLEEEVDRLESESEEYAQLQSRCFDGGGSHASVFDEVSELRAQLAAAQEENKLLMMNLTQCGEQLAAAILKATKPLEDQLATAEQRVAEACALQVATETKFHWLDAARVAKEIRSGEWRKFVKEV